MANQQNHDNRGYRLSVGPWNIHEGADPFGPPVRSTIPRAAKFEQIQAMGFDAVMLHDDDAVPDLEALKPAQAVDQAKQLRRTLDDQNLAVEMVAPRIWEDERGIDGPFTANDKAVRQWALDRARRCADLCRELGTNILVLWLAREGTYIRESKDALQAHQYLLDAINAILEHDPQIHIAIEPKPNEPMDHAYVPTIGHALALGHQSTDPSRVGGVIETAHAILAGLDPSDEMAFALNANKLWSVHLNDQNGMKFDQDKSFAAVNLRSAFDQVRVLEQANYQRTGMIAFDVKAMRTQPQQTATTHLSNCRRSFVHMVDKARSFDQQQADSLRDKRDYEALEQLVLEHLLGVKG